MKRLLIAAVVLAMGMAAATVHAGDTTPNQLSTQQEKLYLLPDGTWVHKYIPIDTTNAVISGGSGGGGGGAVTVADGADVTLGAKGDSACVSDIASCTLVALTKRQAQDIAAVGAQLPASLGAKTGAGSLSVVPASDGVFTVQGSSANNTALTGNPLLIGCGYQTTGGLAAITAGNNTYANCDARGNLRLGVVGGAAMGAPVDTATTIGLLGAPTTNAASSAAPLGVLSYTWTGSALEYNRSATKAATDATCAGCLSDAPMGRYDSSPTLLTNGQWAPMFLNPNHALVTAKQDLGAVTVTPLTATGTLFTADTNGYDYVSVQLTGGVGTVSFTGSNDNSNFNTLTCVPLAGGASVTSTTTAATYTCSGARYIKFAVTSYTSGTWSGTVYNKTGVPSQVSTVALTGALPTGTNSIGNMLQQSGFAESNTNLGISATYTGATRTPLSWSNYFTCKAYADQAGTLNLQESDDTGSTWQTVSTAAITAAGAHAVARTNVTGALASILYRCVVVNGATAETVARFTSAFTSN